MFMIYPFDVQPSALVGFELCFIKAIGYIIVKLILIDYDI